jgi:hypothetical protein
MSGLASLIEVVDSHNQEDWLVNCYSPADAREMLEGVADHVLMNEVNKLRAHLRLLRMERDIKWIEDELKWREEKRRFDGEQAAVAAKAAKAAANGNGAVAR